MPQIAIEYYFILVAMNSGLEPEQALTVLIVVERVCNHAFAKGQQFVINSLCAHRYVPTLFLSDSRFRYTTFRNHHIKKLTRVN